MSTRGRGGVGGGHTPDALRAVIYSPPLTADLACNPRMVCDNSVMEADDLALLNKQQVILMWPQSSYHKTLYQGILGLKRPRPDEWEVFDPLAAHDEVHPRFRAKDVSRVVEINGNKVLLMVYPDEFSAAAVKSVERRETLESRGGAYGKA